MKKYLSVQGNDVNCLKIEVYYHLGGINYFTYKDEQRGYYLSISPINKRGNTESYTAFSGIKILLLEVKRKSNKSYNEALKLAKDLEEKYIKYVCDRNNLKLL